MPKKKKKNNCVTRTDKEKDHAHSFHGAHHEYCKYDSNRSFSLKYFCMQFRSTNLGKKSISKKSLPISN